MRKLAKSVMSYTWAMSMLGVQQIVNLVTARHGEDSGEAYRALERATELAAQSMPEPLRSTFWAADKIQREMMGAIFGDPSGSLSSAWHKPVEAAESAVRVGKTVVEEAPQLTQIVASAGQIQGWGPMP
jgi:hypothetical protein